MNIVENGWKTGFLNSHKFCIDIVAYAVMSNHYHVILRVDEETALSLSDHEVIERWSQLYAIHPIASHFYRGEGLSSEDQLALSADITQWRHTLAGIGKQLLQIINGIDHGIGDFT